MSFNQPVEFRREPCNLQSETLANSHHFVCPSRRSPDSQNRVVLLQQANCDGMKDLTESLVTNVLRTGQIHQWQR